MLNHDIFCNRQRSGYEEVFSYGPYFFKDIKDLDASLKFAGLTLDIMAEKLELLMKDQFIVSADKETIYRYEEWLGLEHDSNKSLVDRRKKVKLLWNGGEKLNGELIKNLVKSYTGCDEDPIVIMTTKLTIKSQITGNNLVYMDDLLEQLEKMKPAHILIEMLLDIAVPIKIGKSVKHYVYDYPVAGITPDISTLGDNNVGVISANSVINSTVYEHKQTSESIKAGTLPEQATIGISVDSITSVGESVESNLYDFKATSENLAAGTSNEIGTLGESIKSNIKTTSIITDFGLTYKQCREEES